VHPTATFAWTPTTPQVSVSTFAGDVTSVAVDAFGNVYTTGTFSGTVDFDPGAGTSNLTSAGLADHFVLKLDSSGNYVWAKRFGNSENDMSYSVAVDTSGNVYTTGRFSGTLDFDPGVGTSNLTSAAYDDVFVLKLDSSGNYVWAKKFGSSGSDWGASVAVDASGNVYATGFWNSIDALVLKLGSAGNLVWTKTFAGAGEQRGTSIAVDVSGNVYTTGFFENTVDFDPGPGISNFTAPYLQADAFVSKLDSSGNYVWAKIFSGTDTKGSESVAIDASGNVYTAGYLYGTVDFDPGAGTSNLTSAGSGDVFVSKLDSSGNYVWAKKFGSSAIDSGASVAVDASGNVYTAGLFSGTVDFDPGVGTQNLISAGLFDVFVSKLNTAGNYVWAKKLGGASYDWGVSVAVDTSDNVYTAGLFSGTVDFDPGAGTSNLTSVTSTGFFVLQLDASGESSLSAPTATWTEPSTPSSSRTLAYTLVFNRSISGLTSSDFSNTGTATGCVFTPSAGSGTTITVGVACSSDGTVIARLAANGVSNGITGPVAALNAVSVTIDTDAPTATWTEPSTPSSSRTLSYTLVFNRSVTGIAAGDFSNTGTATGCVFTPSGSSGSSVTVSVACSSDGTVVARIAADAVSASGMTGPVAALNAASVTIDTDAPTATWTEPSTPSSSRTLSYTLVFNRSVTGVAAGDFSNTGTATGCVFTPSGSSGSSVTVSVVCSSDGTVVARIAAGAVSASGMTGPVSGVSASSVTIDTVPTPTTTIPPTPTTTTAPRTTITTIGNAATTTVAPSPVVTVAVGQISIATIAPSLPGATTSTTTTSPIRASIAPMSTPTPTSTVQSTIPVTIATVAPAQPATTLAPIDVSTIPRGGSALRIAGKEVPLKITRRDNQLLLNAQNFDAAFSGVRTDGATIPLDADGNIRLDKGDAIKVAVTGFAPGSQVEIRLYSDPILLGMGAVNDEGSVTRAYQIPETVPAGSHRVVLSGKNYSGDTVVFTVGIVLGSQESASGLIRTLIAIPILVAIFLALFLPAFLRRRKKPVSV